MASYSSFLHLYAANTQKQVSRLVEKKCISKERDKIKEILDSWKKATESLKKIESEEKGIADSCKTYDLHPSLVDTVKKDKNIQRAFSKHIFDIKLVELDQVIASQHEVAIDYTDKLLKKIPKSPTDEDLINFCLIPKNKVPLPETSKKVSSTVSFTSPSIDMRFLGGYLKKYLTMEDLDYTKVKGVPTHVISLFVGYGIPCMSAYQIKGRIILHNGFHRAYTLRKKGITKIPLLLKKVENWDDKLQDKVNDFKRDFLLNHPRPIMLKDFFNEDLTRIFKRKKRKKVIRVNWESKQFSEYV